MNLVKTLIQQIINLVKTLIQRWKSETPRIAKRVRNAAGIIAIAVPAAYGSVAAMGIDINGWAKQAVAAVTFVSTLIVGIAGTKETNNGRAKRELD